MILAELTQELLDAYLSAHAPSRLGAVAFTLGRTQQSSLPLVGLLHPGLAPTRVSVRSAFLRPDGRLVVRVEDPTKVPVAISWFTFDMACTHADVKHGSIYDEADSW